MTRVCFFSNFGDCGPLVSLLERQTPGFVNRQFRELQIVDADQNYDYAVVFNWAWSNGSPVKLKTPPERTLGYLMEPPEIESLNLDRIAGIGHYYSPIPAHRNLLGNRFHHTVMRMFLHTPIHGDNTYVPSKKPRKMSMIVSAKVITPYQQKRYDLCLQLMRSPLPIDFYGRDLVPGRDKRIKGPLPSVDKRKGLEDYSMSLAFENTCYPECISEKLYDCAVNNCIPITNAPGAAKYLPANSYIFLDFNKPTAELVSQVGHLCRISQQEITKFDKPLMEAKQSILTGKLSLMEAIYNNITSLSKAK